jgi:sialidase-1
LVVLVDKLFSEERSSKPEDCRNYLYFSSDEGMTWDEPEEIPLQGIVPDKLLELHNGRWIVTAHFSDKVSGYLSQRLWMSDDYGRTWQGPIVVGRKPGLNLCEASILSVDDVTLVAFMRENSGKGWDCYKTLSYDGGLSWGEPIAFPLPGCHRPVSGWLNDGDILITHRFMQGGLGWTGWWTQNFFAALTDKDSILAKRREAAHTRILPVDFDRSPASDTGYSGWVQFADGEIYIVNYIVDDAPNGQIRGYSLRVDDFILHQ